MVDVVVVIVDLVEVEEEEGVVDVEVETVVEVAAVVEVEVHQEQVTGPVLTVIVETTTSLGETAAIDVMHHALRVLVMMVVAEVEAEEDLVEGDVVVTEEAGEALVAVGVVDLEVVVVVVLEIEAVEEVVVEVVALEVETEEADLTDLEVIGETEDLSRIKISLGTLLDYLRSQVVVQILIIFFMFLIIEGPSSIVTVIMFNMS